MNINGFTNTYITSPTSIEGILEKYSGDEVSQFVQNYLQERAPDLQVQSSPVSVGDTSQDAFTFEASAIASLLPQDEDFHFSSGIPPVSFLTELYQADTLASVWFKIQNASLEVSDRTLSELGNNALGFSHLSDYFITSIYQHSFKDISLRTIAPKSVLHRIKKHFPNIIQENQLSENRSYDELIGSATQPGTVIVQLRAFATTAQLLDSQKHAIQQIEKCFVDQSQLKLFSANPDQRKKQYETLAQLLSLVLTHRTLEDLERYFLEGEGSLCELPGVCYTGWTQRIKALIPGPLQSPEGLAGVIHKQREFKRNIVYTKMRTEVIDTVYGNLASDHYSNPHTKLALDYLFNEIYQLEFSQQEIGAIEPANIQFIQQSLQARQISTVRLFTKHMGNGHSQRLITDHFETLNQEKKEDFLDEITTYYRGICLKSPCYYLHQHIPLQEQFDELHTLNQIDDPQERMLTLMQAHSSILSAYGINPFSLHPKKVLTLFKTLQENYRRQLHGLNLDQESNTARALLERCREKNIPLSLEDTQLLTDLSHAAIYRATHQEEVCEAISDANIEQHIIDLNCQIFRTLLFKRDSSNMQHISLSGVGTHLIESMIIPKSVNVRSHSDSLGMHIFTGIHEQFWRVKGENSARINSGEALLSKIPETPLLLHFASDDLLNDLAFIVKAHQIYGQAISCIGSQLSEANNYKVILAYIWTTTKPNTRYWPSALKTLECIHRNSKMIAKAASLAQELLEKVTRDLPRLAPLFATKRKVLQLLDHWNPLHINILIRDLLPTYLKENQEILCKAYTKASLEQQGFIACRLRQLMPKNEFLEFVLNSSSTISQFTAELTVLSTPSESQIHRLLERISTEDIVCFFNKERQSVATYDKKFIDLALQKLPAQALRFVLQNQPQLRNHPILTEDLLDGLAMWDLCALLELVPHLRSNQELAQRLFVKYPEFIPKIFKALAPILRNNEDFVYSTLAQCPDYIVFDFYNSPRPELRKTPEFLRAMIETIREQFVIYLIDELSTDCKKDLNLMIELIRKCSPTHITEAVTKPHHTVRKNPIFILAAIECCPPSSIPRFCQRLEKSIRDNLCIAEKVLEKCPVTELSTALRCFSREIQNEYKKRGVDIQGQLQPNKKPRNA